MARGGSRPGAGRPLGSVNRLARDAHERAAATGVLPLDYLLEIMRDINESTSNRLDAAKAAAPYVHAKLQPIDGNGDTTQKVEVKGAFEWHPPQ